MKYIEDNIDSKVREKAGLTKPIPMDHLFEKRSEQEIILEWMKIIKDFKVGFSPDSFDDLLKILRSESFSAEAMKLSGLFIKSEKGYFNRFRSRVMFPIQNYKGNVIAFGGRIFNKDDPAKYQNSPDTPIYNKSNVLYGLSQNSQSIRDKKNVIFKTSLILIK